jgi:hypothetical protein
LYVKVSWKSHAVSGEGEALSILDYGASLEYFMQATLRRVVWRNNQFQALEAGNPTSGSSANRIAFPILSAANCPFLLRNKPTTGRMTCNFGENGRMLTDKKAGSHA